MYLVLGVIVVLIVLSVIGAFLGAVNAKLFFNSVPAAAYWLFLLLSLTGGLFVFPRLVKKKPLLLIHAGCILVLLGGLWGSDTGHHLQRRYFGREKIPSGYMQIYEGQAQRKVYNADFSQEIGELDFSIRLDDFSMEYYPPEVEQQPQLYILMPDQEVRQMDAVVGNEITVSGTEHKLRIETLFKRFKMNLVDGQRVAYDAEEGPDNPALQVDIVKSDGTVETNYVFANHPGMSRNTLGLRFAYELPRGGMPKDFFSELTVLKEGKPVRKKTIEVNKPLYYGGYHFYQHRYDAEHQQYTILSVTSDTGLYAVFAGYGLLAFGVMWQCWLFQAKPRKGQSEWK
jgi:hypothetical protein